jgi:hypothetical protein
VPDKKIAKQLIEALSNFGVVTENKYNSDSDTISSEELEQYLYHGDKKPEFARRLKILRKNKKLTLKKLDELTGIPYSHLSEIENGRRIISVREARKLADVLG